METPDPIMNNPHPKDQDHDDDLSVASSYVKNMFDEAHTALQGAFLMFCIPDLRKMAKAGKLKGNDANVDRLIHLPITLQDILTVFRENKETLTQEALKDSERADMYEYTLGLAKMKNWSDEKKARALERIELVHFEDEHEEDDIVYAVAINHVLKRVVVAFRGSVTKKDFRQDAKAILTPIPNPVKDKNLAETLGIHLGFKEYLYKEDTLLKAIYMPTPKVKIPVPVTLPVGFGGKPSTSDKVDEDLTLHDKVDLESAVETTQMKYQLILDQVLALLEPNPGYLLHIVGHSLGGALSTLFSLEAGAHERIPKPVTCITSGAPKVGAIEFLRAFEYLERNGSIRCLQVANDRDPVTLSPFNGALNPCHALFMQNRRFRHVGLRLKLTTAGFILEYPPGFRNSYCGTLWFDCLRMAKLWIILLIVVPAFLLCFYTSIVIALPLTLCCIYRSLKNSRQHHTQLKYMKRLHFNRQALSDLDIDAMNEKRFSRPNWRFPVLAVRGNHGICQKDTIDETVQEW